MSRHLSCDGTRFHHHGRRVRAADLTPGDTYRAFTVTGNPYTDRITTQHGPVEVIAIPVRTPDGVHHTDTASPDKEDLL